MKNILITGGAGFIGYFLANRLCKKYKVDLIDNFSRGKKDYEFQKLIKNKNINFYKKDLLKKINLKKQYSYIFHLAAIVGVKNVTDHPEKVLTNNLILLKNMIDFAKKQKLLKKFFFFSTSEVYAGSLKKNLIKFPTPENQLICLPLLTDKRSTYLLSKLYGEAMCIHSNLPCIIIRPHNIYGPRMGMSHVIPEMAKRAFDQKKKFTVYNPNHKRTFCYISDFIDATVLLMNKKKIKKYIYNIGNPLEEITMIKLSKKILNYYDKIKKIKKIEINNSSPLRRIPDISNLKKEVNFIPKINLDKGLVKILSWYKKNI